MLWETRGSGVRQASEKSRLSHSVYFRQFLKVWATVPTLKRGQNPNLMAGGEGRVCSQAPAWDVTGLPPSMATAVIVVDTDLKSRVYTPHELCPPTRGTL